METSVKIMTLMSKQQKVISLVGTSSIGTTMLRIIK